MYKSEVFGKGCIYAKVVADSTANDKRITTLELNYPRFIHSEFMTHRMFSRNASSSRAIPVEKMLENISKEPAMPIHWGKNQPGMQAVEELPDVMNPNDSRIVGKYIEWHPFEDIYARSNTVENVWKAAAEYATSIADDMNVAGLHKQIVNRLTEPFQFIKVVVTATEWDNFFMLRLSPDAQPEIQELARCMKEAMDNSESRVLKIGQYHVPYWYEGFATKTEIQTLNNAPIKASVARCARVSYLNHDNTQPNIEKDVELYDKLLDAGHMPPFEHAATPMEYTDALKVWEEEGRAWETGITHMDREANLWSGNFQGWIQYRQRIQQTSEQIIS